MDDNRTPSLLDTSNDSTSPTPRAKAPALDALLGHRFSVLDSGFVRVIDYMGDDAAVVQAARVSYGAGTKRLSEDRGLIRYLMSHRHTTPFEMCEIKLHVRAPMDVWRQWIRHRTANVNEYSTRYSVAIDAIHKTPADHWRMQSQANKQGSTGLFNPEQGARFTTEEQELHLRSTAVYRSRLDAGVAREQARKDLPLSTYTEAYWKIDLHNLLHFLELRMSEHAQVEIRSYAEVIGHVIISKWVPLVWEAFLDYRLGSVTWSAIEVAILRAVIAGDVDSAIRRAREAGLLKANPDGTLSRSRERADLEQKLIGLSLVVPWTASNEKG